MTVVAPRPLGNYVQDQYEVVAEFTDIMPTGVTVSDDGRVFVSFPRWGDDVPFTVAEIVDGAAIAFPNATVNEWTAGESSDHLISVQSVVVDPDGYLWLLDTGAPSFAPYVDRGPKLVRVDLARNEIDRVVRIAGAAMTPTTYLNDVRFDFSNGAYAYITDSQPTGALIVVDLDTGDSWDRLRGHRSTQADDGFRAVVEGLVRDQYRVGADGIAISPTGDRLFYCPLSSRRLYSVDTAALRDRETSDDLIAETVLDHGDKGASDGLETDTEGNLYATAYEHSAVLRRSPTGQWTTVLHAPKLLWPDTLAIAADGHLYVSVNQLPRTPLVQRRRGRPGAAVFDRPGGHRCATDPADTMNDKRSLMKSVLYTRTGDPSVLELVERPLPAIGSGEVRVKVAVSGVNPTDWKARQDPNATLPAGGQVPNQDGAGVVDAVAAGCDGLENRRPGVDVGRRVAACEWNGSGICVAARESGRSVARQRHLRCGRIDGHTGTYRPPCAHRPSRQPDAAETWCADRVYCGRRGRCWSCGSCRHSTRRLVWC